MGLREARLAPLFIADAIRAVFKNFAINEINPVLDTSEFYPT